MSGECPQCAQLQADVDDLREHLTALRAQVGRGPGGVADRLLRLVEEHVSDVAFGCGFLAFVAILWLPLFALPIVGMLTSDCSAVSP